MKEPRAGSSKRRAVFIKEEDDVDMHHPGTGLPLPFPVLIKEDNDITMDDIEKMVERAPTLDDSFRALKQVREELEELDKIIQEFMRGRDPQAREVEAGRNGSYRPRKQMDTDRMNEVLLVVMDNHLSRVSQMGSLTEKDIPHLCEEWMKSCKDIMSSAPERLPPQREFDH